MRERIKRRESWRRLAIPGLALVVIACGPAGPSRLSSAVASPVVSESAAAPSPADSLPSPTDPVPDTGGTTSGDVPDDAVFLRYAGGTPGFSIQYVEGWQVTPRSDGIVIRDKDSSETVEIVAPQTDIGAYVVSIDLPGLVAQAGFKLDTQDTVTVGATRLVHLVYHLPSPPDAVTGKRVPSTVDRYYVPGPSGLAIVSLSTPDGVDNVDAFRQMIESFAWS